METPGPLGGIAISLRRAESAILAGGVKRRHMLAMLAVIRQNRWLDGVPTGISRHVMRAEGLNRLGRPQSRRPPTWELYHPEVSLM